MNYQARIKELAAEMEQWYSGVLTHRLEYIKFTSGDGVTSAAEREAMISVADAQEVFKRSHMIQAYMALDRTIGAP